VRVTVDADLCQGHGVCESEAPAVFELGKRNPVVVLDEHPPEDQRAAVEAAVRFCPNAAITLTDDPS
jgi:sterol 14-demethylase